MKLKLDFSENNIVKYLTLMCLAIFGFGFSGISTIFFGLGIIVGGFAIMTAYKSFSKDDLKKVLPIGISLLVLAGFVAFGAIQIGVNGIISSILMLVGILMVFVLGLSARKIKEINPETIILVIGCSIALFVAICLVTNWVNYGLFYRIIYKNTPAYYYNGVMYNLTDEYMGLYGFKILELNKYYIGLFGVVLSCFLPGALFIKPKEKPVEFALTLITGGIGLITLITAPLIFELCLVFLVFIVALLYRFLKDNKTFHKVTKYGLIVIAVLAVAFFLLLVLNSKVEAIASLVSGNKILNKIFNNNRIVHGVNQMLPYLFDKSCILGVPTTRAYESVIFEDTHMFEIEVLKEGGIFAFLAVIALIIFVVISFAKYLRNSEDSHFTKVTFLSLLVGYFLVASFNGTVLPLGPHDSTVYQSMMNNPIFLIIVFIIGYTLLNKVQEVKAEPKEKEHEKEINYEEI